MGHSHLPCKRIIACVNRALVFMALVFLALAPVASAKDLMLWASPVAVGQRAPDFTLEDQSGNRVRLSRQRGSKVVLVFYRGYW